MSLDVTTLIFETINFVVLVLILWRVLYRPLRRSIERRRAALREELERVEQARIEVEEQQAGWAQREGELAELREAARREAIDAAEKRGSAILERARDDASAELSRARQLLETEREASARWVEGAIWERGTALAGRMLLALAPEELDRALGERLVQAIERDAEAVAGALGDDPPDVELTGARLPPDSLVDAIRGALVRAGGRPLHMSTREDDALLAGWTVRVGERLFDGSIAGQLEAFRDLARELEDRGD